MTETTDREEEITIHIKSSLSTLNMSGKAHHGSSLELFAAVERVAILEQPNVICVSIGSKVARVKCVLNIMFHCICYEEKIPCTRVKTLLGQSSEPIDFLRLGSDLVPAYR